MTNRGDSADGAAVPTHGLRIDLDGRLRNTHVAKHHALLPLFEAVVNSMHACEERWGDEISTRGEVVIKVHRVPQPELPGTPGRPPVEEIEGFTIVDNGIGFTDANQRSFETADSTSKIARGGKGVGRFTWLVVFGAAVVDSVYEDADGRRRRRCFRFEARPTGAIHEYVEEPTEHERGTSVELLGVRSRYSDAIRKAPEVLAEQVFSHCFNYFVLGRCPVVRLLDLGSEDERSLMVNDYRDELSVSEPESVEIGGHPLTLTHVQQRYRAGRKHEAHLCANERVVTSFSLTRISELGADSIPNADGHPVVHHVFVSGKALDDAVDPTRTRLDLPDGAPLLEHRGELDLKTLREEVGALVDARLGDILNEVRAANFERVAQHIRRVQPEFRHLIGRRREQLERVKWSENQRHVDEQLYRLHQDYEADVRRRQAAVEDQLEADEATLDAVAQGLQGVVEEINEVGQANLVKYVLKRRSVLNLLSRMVSRFSERALEEEIHKIVFPLKRTGDDVALDEHNLWLVDDSLTFYDLLASDIPFRKVEGASVDSLRRPDIFAFRTGQPAQHIALVEFKRPDRDDENPVRQLVEYAQLLRKGGALDSLGRMMPGIDLSIRIDAYAVVSMTPKLEDQMALSPGDVKKVQGEWRWYGHVTSLNTTIEVLDFQAFLERASERNRAFFVKLGLK